MIVAGTAASGPVLMVVLFGLGLDQFAAGAFTVAAGRPIDSQLKARTSQVLQRAGVEKTRADQYADWVETFVLVVADLAALLQARGLPGRVSVESPTSGSACAEGVAPKGKTPGFPQNPHDFTKQLGVPPSKVGTTPDGTLRMEWRPSDNIRIRYESHPGGLKPGDPGFNPRLHGPHYHVETKPSGLSWNQAEKQGKITKVKPEGYTPGSGTGFLPYEPLPGQPK